VLWGTDSIWYGTPQWQIEAFRRFTIPEALGEKYGYAALSRTVKEQIFGLNAARVFGVDAHATRNAIPQDYLSRIKMAYLDEGATPSPLVSFPQGLHGSQNESHGESTPGCGAPALGSRSAGRRAPRAGTIGTLAVAEPGVACASDGRCAVGNLAQGFATTMRGYAYA
jgi:hypothetical protein